MFVNKENKQRNLYTIIKFNKMNELGLLMEM